MDWADYLKFGLVQVMVTFGAAYLAFYIREKGKNLATREDIHEITDKIESVKIEYAKELEVRKAEYSAQLKYFESQLSRRLQVDGIRFQKEFQVYQEVWAALVDFQKAAAFLRAVINFPPPKPGTREDALSKFRERRDVFESAFGKNSPFVAKEVYIALSDLIRSRLVTELSLYKPECSPLPEAPIDRERELQDIDLDNKEMAQQVIQIGGLIRERIER
jgi:hypothetical protein